MTTTYVPRQEIITGVDLTGSDGDLNRTYTLHYLPTSSTATVTVQTVPYTLNVDYTFNGTIITFLGSINNFMTIQLDYFQTQSLINLSSVGVLRYTSVEGFARYMGLLQMVPNKDTPTRETVGVGDNTTTEFYLDNEGIIEGTYQIGYGAAFNLLTETTHYTLNLANSRLTLTAAGVTLVALNTIYAQYSFFSINSGLTNAEAIQALSSAENKITNVTNEVFVEYTDTDPKYKKVVDEMHHANSPSMADWKNRGKVFDLAYPPFINLTTYISGDYTTGSTSITVLDATGFPLAGTIYIGGNKVAYTAKTGNTLTVPSTTPSIVSGALVKGEVVEISFTPEGGTTLFNIADPDQDYDIDYIQGRILLLSNAYWNQNVTHAEDTVYPTRYRVRICYMNCWYEQSELPYIPIEINQVAYQIAAQSMYPRIIARAYLKGNNNFRPGAFNSSKQEINDVLINYKPLNVATSPYNRSRLS